MYVRLKALMKLHNKKSLKISHASGRKCGQKTTTTCANLREAQAMILGISEVAVVSGNWSRSNVVSNETTAQLSIQTNEFTLLLQRIEA